MTAVSILKKMKDKLDEFGQVIKVATKSKKEKVTKRLVIKTWNTF